MTEISDWLLICPTPTPSFFGFADFWPLASKKIPPIPKKKFCCAPRVRAAASGSDHLFVCRGHTNFYPVAYVVRLRMTVGVEAVGSSGTNIFGVVTGVTDKGSDGSADGGGDFLWVVEVGTRKLGVQHCRLNGDIKWAPGGDAVHDFEGRNPPKRGMGCSIVGVDNTA